MSSFSEREDVQEILRNYRTAGHPTAFSAPHTVYKYYGKRIPLSVIQRALQINDSYTLHREYKKPASYNPYYVYRRRQHFQGDLIDVSSLAADNDNITFLFIIMDVFSRRMWIVPLQRKTAEETSQALASWLDIIDAPHCFAPNPYLLTDSGKEFLNRKVRAVAEVNGLELRQAKNVNKVAICERANKTIQVLIYKYLTDKGETRYLDALPMLLRSYNSRKHRSLQNISPDLADLPSNEATIASLHLKRNSKIKRKKVKLCVGDKVRIKTHAKAPSSARRAYLQQFHGEIFTVERISTRMPIPFYYIKSMNDGELIDGGFYANELSRLEGETFKIESILQTVGRGRRKKHLVRWRYFDERWNSWVLDSELQHDG